MAGRQQGRNWQDLPGSPEEGEEQGARRASGASPSSGEILPLRPANPEVEPQATRRRFDRAYKLRILQEAESCSSPRDIGALLRREGLYSSHLVKWRYARNQGGLQALEPQKRGPKPDPAVPLHRKVRDLEAENEKLRRKLRQAETIIQVQKKVSEILGITLAQVEDDETS